MSVPGDPVLRSVLLMGHQRRRTPTRSRVTTAAAGLASVFALGLAGCGSPGSTGQVRPLAAVQESGSSPSTASAPAAAATPPAAVASVPASASASSSASASVEVRTETVTRSLKFRTVTRKDPDLDQGEQRVVSDGAKGAQELTFRVTYTDGEETGRELVSKRTVRKPVDRVVAIGTRVAQPAGGDCDPNYTGDCVPIDSDVDCAGGSGNGPSYVQGPVRVVGDDIYGLDRDGDGIGCE